MAVQINRSAISGTHHGPGFLDVGHKTVIEAQQRTEIDRHLLGHLPFQLLKRIRAMHLIQAGIDEGARLVAGGTGRPEGFNRGYFVRPTVFADVNNDMRIAREEIFGPVLSIIPFEGEDQAVEISNDTSYGLTDYVQSGDNARTLSASLANCAPAWSRPMAPAAPAAARSAAINNPVTAARAASMASWSSWKSKPSRAGRPPARPAGET